MKITHVVVGVLASSVLVAGCVVEDAAVPVVEVAVEDDTAVPLELRIVDQPYVFNQEFFDELFRERNPDSINRNDFEGFSNWRTFAQNFKVESVEFVEDDLGPYARYKVALHEEYLDLIPMEYHDGSPITEFSKEDVQDAVRFFANYSLNEFVDSPALDNPKEWDSWWENGGKDYFLPQAQEYILSTKQEYDPSRRMFEEDESSASGYYTIDSTVPMLSIIHAPTDYTDESSVSKSVRDGKSRVINKKIADLTFEKLDNKTLLIKGAVGSLVRVDYDSFWRERDFEGNGYIVNNEDYWNSNMNEGKTWRDNYNQNLEIMHPKSDYLYLSLVKDNGEWKIAGMGYAPTSGSMEGMDISYEATLKGYSEYIFEEWHYERFIEYVPAR